MPRTLRIAATTCALAVALSTAGCNTVGRQKSTPTVRTTDASYQTGQELPPDIKQILMAGGLDADNPSAPANPPVTLASADIDTKPAGDVVLAAANPPSGQVLMAAGGHGAGQTMPSLAVGSGAVAPRLPDILLATAAKGTRAKPAIVAASRATSSKTRGGVRLAAVMAKTAAPPASQSVRRPSPETQGSPIRFASINAGAKAEAQQKKVVRRF